MLTLERLLARPPTPAAGPAGGGDQAPDPLRRAGREELVRRCDRFGPATPADRGAQLVTVMSFSPVGVRRVRLLAPSLPTVLLHERMPGWSGRPPPGAGSSGRTGHLRADPGGVRRAHAAGHQVYVWTVDKPADIDLVLGLGVDAVITNRPRDVLRARAARSG